MAKSAMQCYRRLYGPALSEGVELAMSMMK